MTLNKNLAVIVVVLGFFEYVKCRGRMIDPPQRGSMWRAGFPVPPNYNDMSDNTCGMVKQQWDVERNCGVCGDPRDAAVKEHEPPHGKYATGIIGRTYQSGQVITTTIDITANHKGYFEFRLCESNEKMKTVTQDCFDQHLLLVLNNNEGGIQIPTNKDEVYDSSKNQYKYFLPDQGVKKYHPKIQLPLGVKCSACILQWRYRGGNNFGKNQEEIFNCADISIV